jgi:hypothetical protein
MMAAQAILDRGYGRPHQTQSIDASISEAPVRYVEVPHKADSAEVLASPTDASLGHCRAGIGQGELGHMLGQG